MLSPTVDIRAARRMKMITRDTARRLKASASPFMIVDVCATKQRRFVPFHTADKFLSGPRCNDRNLGIRRGGTEPQMETRANTSQLRTPCRAFIHPNWLPCQHNIIQLRFIELCDWPLKANRLWRLVDYSFYAYKFFGVSLPQHVKPYWWYEKRWKWFGDTGVWFRPTRGGGLRPTLTGANGFPST